MTALNALLSPDEFFTRLNIPPGTGRLLIAYSGGLDSQVLLHLMHEYTRQTSSVSRLLALHVNHGLNPRAAEWATHCQAVCQQWQIDFRQVELDARAPKGESQEAWARKLRYQALQEFVEPQDVLMTAHHQDDMAETLLIQLFRGSGPAGLAAMPVKAVFGQGWHYRPLLDYTRNQLSEYAQRHELIWIDDDSNLDDKYDRNLIRNTILPSIRQRWPAVSQTLHRAARLQAEAASLLEQLATMDLQTCATGSGKYLRVSSLVQLPNERAVNVLRYWIRTEGFPVPTARQLAEIFSGVIQASQDTSPCVSWSGTQLRRYRDYLFIIAPLPVPPDTGLEIKWDLTSDCTLILGKLYAGRSSDGTGLRAGSCMNDSLIVRFRRGDETIRLAGHHHQLRKLYQQYGVAACYRDFVPLLYSGNTLVAIPGMVIADEFRAGINEAGWTLHWTESSTVCPGSGKEVK